MEDISFIVQFYSTANCPFSKHYKTEDEASLFFSTLAEHTPAILVKREIDDRDSSNRTYTLIKAQNAIMDGNGAVQRC